MERETLASVIQNAPAWLRAELASQDASIRERAADALAAIILGKLNAAEDADLNQLALPL